MPSIVNRSPDAIQAELASKGKADQSHPPVMTFHSSPIVKGDVVTMKCGGPAMCVVEINGQDAFLSWFHDGSIKPGKLPLVCLKKGGDS